MGFLVFSRFHAAQLALCLLLLGRIAAGYSIFSATYDEHAHIGRGMLWLETGIYEDDGFQMPLPRLFFAIPPHLAGYTVKGSWLVNDWTNQTAQDYWRSLTLARAGNLPFVIALFVGVAAFSRRMFGEKVSLAASAALACCPNVIGHGGLATLDIGGTAGFFLGMFAFWHWRQRPGLGRTVLAGFVFGVAEISKFSSAAFLALPILFAVWKGARAERISWGRLAAHAACFGCVAFLTIWAGYALDVWEVNSYRHATAAREGRTVLPAADLLQEVRLPAPKFWRGFVDMAYLQQEGFPAFLNGEIRRHGWWHYFPTALVLKGSPPLLLLGVLGFFCLWRKGGREREAAVFLAVAFFGILAVSTPSTLNIGIRHVLPLFPILCVLGAGAFAPSLSRRRWVSLAACALLGWHAVESLMAHPNYLAYFNPAFRQQDYRYLSDSNLDWGQDRARLGEWLAANESKDVCALAMQAGDILKLYPTPPGSVESSEWVVLTTNQWALIQFDEGQREETREMFRREPWGRIGRSMLIFHFPERAKREPDAAAGEDGANARPEPGFVAEIL